MNVWKPEEYDFYRNRLKKADDVEFVKIYNEILDVANERLSGDVVELKQGFLVSTTQASGLQREDGAYIILWEMPYMNAVVRYFINHNVKKGGTVIDFGCCNGGFSFSLASDGYRIIGIDCVERAVANCTETKKLFKPFDDACTFIYSLVEATPLPDNCADGILSCECLEHIREPARALQEAKRLLKPEGFFVFTTPEMGIGGSCAHLHNFTEGEIRALFSTLTDKLHLERIKYSSLSREPSQFLIAGRTKSTEG